MIDIQVDQPAYRHRRRSNNGWRFIASLIFFLASLIPACIIAWRIDLLRVQPQAQVIQKPQQAVAVPKPKLKPTARERPPRIERELSPQPNEPPLIQKPPREPIADPPPKPQQEVALKLTKIQREPITLDGNVRVFDLRGHAAKIEPEGGKLPAVVTLEGKRPVILRVSTDSPGNERLLVIEPTIKNDAGKDVPFTVEALTAIGRRITKQGIRAARELAALREERDRLQAWLNAPGGKPGVTRDQAARRVGQLNVTVPQAEQVVAALQAEVIATRELVEWARRVQDDCSLVLESD